jgi:hypothetical protein
MEQIIPKSLPVTNKKVIEILSFHKPWHGKILDLGAKEGYFSSLIANEFSNNGCNSLSDHIFACDLFDTSQKNYVCP